MDYLEDDYDDEFYSNENNNPPQGGESADEGSRRRQKRYISARQVNVSMTEYLDTGTWYLSVYNDGLATIKVNNFPFK